MIDEQKARPGRWPRSRTGEPGARILDDNRSK
jgi:hypothetical protein